MSVSPLAVSIANRLIPRASRPAVQGSSNITDAPRLPRQEIGPAKEHIHRELLEMYWKGVKRELAHMVLTLKKWQQAEYERTLLPDEEDDFIHGFDTFLDQVSHSCREFALCYDEKLARQHTINPLTYKEALRDHGWDILANGRKFGDQSRNQGISRGTKEIGYTKMTRSHAPPGRRFSGH